MKKLSITLDRDNRFIAANVHERRATADIFYQKLPEGISEAVLNEARTLIDAGKRCQLINPDDPSCRERLFKFRPDVFVFEDVLWPTKSQTGLLQDALLCGENVIAGVTASSLTDLLSRLNDTQPE